MNFPRGHTLRHEAAFHDNVDFLANRYGLSVPLDPRSAEVLVASLRQELVLATTPVATGRRIQTHSPGCSAVSGSLASMPSPINTRRRKVVTCLSGPEYYDLTLRRLEEVSLERWKTREQSRFCRHGGTGWVGERDLHSPGLWGSEAEDLPSHHTTTHHDSFLRNPPNKNVHTLPHSDAYMPHTDFFVTPCARNNKSGLSYATHKREVFRDDKPYPFWQDEPAEMITHTQAAKDARQVDAERWKPTPNHPPDKHQISRAPVAKQVEVHQEKPPSQNASMSPSEHGVDMISTHTEDTAPDADHEMLENASSVAESGEGENAEAATRDIVPGFLRLGIDVQIPKGLFQRSMDAYMFVQDEVHVTGRNLSEPHLCYILGNRVQFAMKKERVRGHFPLSLICEEIEKNGKFSILKFRNGQSISLAFQKPDDKNVWIRALLNVGAVLRRNMTAS